MLRILAIYLMTGLCPGSKAEARESKQHSFIEKQDSPAILLLGCGALEPEVLF
jgi:hypothetical protein